MNKVTETNAWRDNVSLLRNNMFGYSVIVPKHELTNTSIDYKAVHQDRAIRALREEIENRGLFNLSESSMIDEFYLQDSKRFESRMLIMSPTDLFSIMHKFGEELLNEERRKQERVQQF